MEAWYIFVFVRVGLIMDFFLKILWADICGFSVHLQEFR